MSVLRLIKKQVDAHHGLLTLLLYLAAVTGAYWSIRNNAFIGDDYYFLQKVSHESIFQSWQPAEPFKSFIRPLPMVVWWLQYQFFHLSELPAHLINIWFHAASAFLLYWFLKTAGIGRLPAFMAGMLFTVTPIAPESVTLAGGRFEIFALFFALLSLGMYSLYLKDRKPVAYLTSLLALIAALLCKENALILLILIPALDVLFWPLLAGQAGSGIGSRSYQIKKAAIRLLPVAGIFVAYAISRYTLIRGVGGYSPLIAEYYSLTNTFLTFGVFLDPLNQEFASRAFYYFLGTYTILLVLVSSMLLVFRWKRASAIAQRMCLFLVIFFVASLIPVQWYVFSRGVTINLVGSHFLYIPALALLAMLCLILFEFGWKNRKWRAVIAIGLLPLLFLYVTGLVINNHAWEETALAFAAVSEGTISSLPDPAPGSVLNFELKNDLTPTSIMIDGALPTVLQVEYERDDLIINNLHPSPVPPKVDGYLFLYDVSEKILTRVQ